MSKTDERTHRLGHCGQLSEEFRVGLSSSDLFEFRGVVIESRCNSCFLTYTIDDSTGLLDVSWRYKDPQTKSLIPLYVSGIPDPARRTLIDPKKIELGSFLVVRGHLRSYRGKLELLATWIHIDSDPNAECIFLLQKVQQFMTKSTL